MKYFSICSGIESASVAWHPLGFECVGVTEIDPFRSAVLNYHYPEVKNYGDFTKVEKEDIGGSPDIVVGGTPCATFSIAGLREGIESDRGNLALEFIRFVKRTNPKWVVWENVPGVLSSNEGRDFGSFIGGLAECGYGFAYRVLDTQYIRTQRFPRAIPQMRRRIFVVGHIRDWRRSAEVLFDEESLSGNHPPCRKEGEGTSTETQASTTRCDKSLKFRSGDFGRYVEDNVSSTIKARDYKSATDLISEKVDTNTDLTVIHGNSSRVNGDGFRKNGVSYTLTATEIPSIYNEIEKENKDDRIVFERSSPDGIARMRSEEVSPTLNGMTGGNRQPCFVEKKSVIRRLTPIETERLQGLPDNYTQIPYNGKPKEDCPISKRYEACGRAMSINVMEHLGTRIKMVQEKYGD